MHVLHAAGGFGPRHLCQGSAAPRGAARSSARQRMPAFITSRSVTLLLPLLLLADPLLICARRICACLQRG